MRTVRSYGRARQVTIVTTMGRGWHRAVVTASPSADRVADAAITVIARDGLDALSVRAVARQAGVTGGAVQHHFPTKNELTLGAFDRTLRRQTTRVASLPARRTVTDRLVRELCSILPSDPDSREEAVVWIAMSAAVTGNEDVAARHARFVEQTRRWIAATVRRAIAADEIAASVDAVRVAPLIDAALDGMMLQAIAADDTHEVLCDRLATIVTALLR